MAQTETQNSSIFNQAHRAGQQITSTGLRRSEWWLNVNYAEVIEIKDAVGLGSLRTRLAS
ncbi:hypothetical protein IB286_01665 [Spongiibacter sp. KMU-158]|uniref:Uncharacterized protein n=1 Tax=Spongiibacter pelagi TaxID=2760804 RepID=A0A927C130_9GAMM|nr:hypothetical protein [Spongiibacter pelagi]MBD2857696.1 hypothetical protein [Spongiibacter pelagi]